jgi:ArsR family transcriptional regulator, virulence genes transcriptional regulator
MMSTQLRVQALRQADFFRVFSNATRLCILCALADRELSVGEIAAAAETSLQNVSQHLHLMQDKGILASRRESQTVYYRITDNDLVKRYILPLQKFCADHQANGDKNE